MNVTDEMLASAMKKAVTSGMIPTMTDHDTYLRNWSTMKQILQDALDSVLK